MPKWLLPTLSEVVSLGDPTGMVGTDQPGTQLLQTCAPDATKASGAGRRSGGHVALQQLRADREWAGAIAALNDILYQTLQQANLTHPAIADSDSQFSHAPSPQLGVVISGPSPVISHPAFAQHLSSWTLAATSIHSPNWRAFRLLPAETAHLPSDPTPNSVLPILPGDPLAAEQFCLVLTPWFSLVLVLGESLAGTPAFMFSFAPEVVQQAWDVLRPRILLLSPNQIAELDALVHQFPPVTPDYTTVMQFSRLLLAHLPDTTEDLKPKAETEGLAASLGRSPQPPVQPGYRTAHFAQTPNYHHDVAVAAHAVAQNAASTAAEADPHSLHSLDVELVKAIAHEVRTPLTTIRTLTRSLLRRKDLSADVLRRLSIIDRECSEQIDRFGLIFKAVELETSATHLETLSLTRTSLTDVLQQSIPRWQQQAQQRQMTLDVILPQRMPTVVSDPTTLDQALTSLIERFTRNLPAGSHIQVEVTPAGNQLKLQLHSQPEANLANGQAGGGFASKFNFPSAKSLGHMLMFQPETGSLSLNLAVTKNLFQAIGGKLTVKQRPQQGEVMTVYLPLELGGNSPLDQSNIITV